MMQSNILHNYADHQILGIIRLTVYSIWLVLIIKTPLQVYAHLPTESFSTWGFYQLIFILLPGDALDLILSSGFLFGLKMALIICCTLCAVGYRPYQPLAVVTLILLFLFDAVVRGYYGFTNHAQLGLLYCTFILTLFPASDGYSIFGLPNKKAPLNQYKVPVVVASVLLCLPYSFIGVHRLIYGGIEIFTNDALLYMIAVQSLNYSGYNFDYGLIILQSEYIANIFKAGFIIITVFEVLTPLLLVNRFFRYAWLSLIIPFHVLTLLTMNIFFWENLILIMVLFSELPYVIKNNMTTK